MAHGDEWKEITSNRGSHMAQRKHKETKPNKKEKNIINTAQHREITGKAIRTGRMGKGRERAVTKGIWGEENDVNGGKEKVLRKTKGGREGEKELGKGL